MQAVVFDRVTYRPTLIIIYQANEIGLLMIAIYTIGDLLPAPALLRFTLPHQSLDSFPTPIPLLD